MSQIISLKIRFLNSKNFIKARKIKKIILKIWSSGSNIYICSPKTKGA
jgi:hypothetical protein